MCKEKKYFGTGCGSLWHRFLLRSVHGSVFMASITDQLLNPLLNQGLIRDFTLF